MLRKGGNISSATSSLTNLPLTPFSSALSKVSFRKVLPWPSRHRGVWSAVRMRATGWPDNFADTWELQMLPRASSLLNVSVEAVRRPARFFSSSSLSFSSSPPPCVSSFFLPLPLSLFSFFFFFRPSRRHRGTFKLATVDEQRASVKLDYFFFPFMRRWKNFSRIFLRIFDPCFVVWISVSNCSWKRTRESLKINQCRSSYFCLNRLSIPFLR